MMQFKILVLLTVLYTTTAYSASKCPELYPNGVVLTSIEGSTVELCNPNYVVRYDPVRKASIFSAEKIQANQSAYPRSDTFKSDKRLATGTRAENSDYLYAPYDRGHMTPADDMSTLDEMKKSFLLSNMTPQNKNLNRGAMKKLEHDIKKNKSGTIYILTGAVYDDKPKTIGDNKIPVPSIYYKCVFYSVKSECFKLENKSNATLYGATLKETLEMVRVK